MNSSHNTRLRVIAKKYINGKTVTFETTGRNAQTLLALIKAGDKGITALELSNTWALRLSAYIHCLRHVNGLDIITHKEGHDGGWHARYVLITPAEIFEITEV